MEENKRWAVTYTKQMKQKRKIYHDGSLQLRSTSNKVFLFDDCGQLLECRVLKKDEVVTSGETLTFCSYLVDIGDREGEQKCAPELNSNDKEKTIGQKRNLLQRQIKHRDSGIFHGHGKASSENHRDQQKCLSPSQRVIREFKKRELHKIVRTSPSKTKSNMTEWKVLYTTQLTQKAKRYHDGLLQMTASGSVGRQIMLFDDAGKLLEMRFLKKADLLKSGESILFDAYLVEVGEHQNNHEPHSDIVEDKHVQMQQNYVKNNEAAETEWNVLYTTQVIQKAKKYHEGFLKLSMCGSISQKASLYDANRRVLDSRFLKQYETIKPGKSFVFDAYLVDIGEPEGHSDIILKPSILKNGRDISVKTVIADAQRKSQYNACAENDTLSNYAFSSVDKQSLNKAMPKRPLRNALQIMSFLQKPLDPSTADLTSTNKALTSENSVSADNGIKDVAVDNSHQPYSNAIEAHSDWPGNALACGVSTSSISLFGDLDDHKSESLEEIKNGKEADGCPSFDIGF